MHVGAAPGRVAERSAERKRELKRGDDEEADCGRDGRRPSRDHFGERAHERLPCFDVPEESSISSRAARISSAHAIAALAVCSPAETRTSPPHVACPLKLGERGVDLAEALAPEVPEHDKGPAARM